MTVEVDPAPNSATSVPPIDGKVGAAGTVAFGTGIVGDASARRWEVDGDAQMKWRNATTGAIEGSFENIGSGVRVNAGTFYTLGSVQIGYGNSFTVNAGNFGPASQSAVVIGECNLYRVRANELVGSNHDVASGTAPTPSALAASTGVSVDANAHDQAGQVNVTPANAVAADTAVVRVTFALAYASAPVVVVTPMNGESAKVQPIVTNVGTGAFDIAIHVPSAVGAACKFAYRVIGVS